MYENIEFFIYKFFPSFKPVKPSLFYIQNIKHNEMFSFKQQNFSANLLHQILYITIYIEMQK